MVDVVAALVWEEGKFMICQRPANKARGLLWEFAGGKVEEGERREDALNRELTEELAMTVIVDDIFMEVVHEYPDITVNLILYNCRLNGTYPTALEHNDIKWIHPRDIDNFEFCPADEDILKKIKEVYLSD